MPKIQRTYIGVDPGQRGGICAIYGNSVKICKPIPKTLLELWKTIDSCNSLFRPYAAIEQVHSSPQQGVVSAFTFGRGYGWLLMGFTASGIPFETVRPQQWQKSLLIPSRKKAESQPQFKKRLLLIAQSYYPHLKIWEEPRSVGKQLAISDALLIATYIQRKDQGKL